MKGLKQLMCLSAVLICLATTAAFAEAGGHSGSFVITNPNKSTIYYQVKWGDDGEWESYCLHPGCKRCHYIELDANGCAPKPYIRFDYIANDNECTYESYGLNFYAVCNPWQGKQYVFYYSGCYLDLYVK